MPGDAAGDVLLASVVEVGVAVVDVSTDAGHGTTTPSTVQVIPLTADASGLTMLPTSLTISLAIEVTGPNTPDNKDGAPLSTDHTRANRSRVLPGIFTRPRKLSQGRSIVARTHRLR